jgi:hypothetical protein
LGRRFAEHAELLSPMQEKLQLLQPKEKEPPLQLEIKMKRDHCSTPHTHRLHFAVQSLISAVTHKSECLAIEKALRQTCQLIPSPITPEFRLQALKVIETFTDIGNVHEARIAASLYKCDWNLEVQLKLAIPTRWDIT